MLPVTLEEAVTKGFREKSAQYRAVVKNRKQMRSRGISRFEVRGLEHDKALIRAVAKRLAAGDDAARKLRTTLAQEAAAATKPVNIVEWLRSSPLVGIDWYIEREFNPGRKIDL